MKKRLAWIGMYLSVIALFFALLAASNGAITVVSENVPIPGRRHIIVDAGHGGEDGGAISCTGKLESACNLEIAQRLEDLLSFLGQKTSLIRSDDRSVYTAGTTLSQKKVSDLKNRVKIVNETENGFLISIHQNTFPDGKYSGAQVFYAKDDFSQKISKQLQSDLISVLNIGSNRECKPAKGIYLMEHITVPGVLVECGFLSNPREEALLYTKAYQQKLCAVVATSIVRALSNT